MNSNCFRYESTENVVITCSTKVCSFGKQVVEKVETEYSRLENSRFVYRIQRSPMCEYMVNFIQKLKHLPERYMMNSVLENFTILQVQLSFFCFWIFTTHQYNLELNTIRIANRQILYEILINCFDPYQVVSNKETNETLLCIAYVFEVAAPNSGAQHIIYRLTKD